MCYSNAWSECVVSEGDAFGEQKFVDFGCCVGDGQLWVVHSTADDLCYTKGVMPPTAGPSLKTTIWLSPSHG
jgi:hypothetical protein